MSYLGDIAVSQILYTKFTTTAPSTGAPTTLSGSPVISIYKDDGDTESTSGITLTVDADSRTGMNKLKIDTSSDGTFYATGHDFQIVITTGTVSGVSAVGYVVGEFSISNRVSNVTKWNGTAVSSPATAGIPDVNIKNMNNVAATSITTINANQGTTQPLNFTGTAGSALVKSDMVDVAGAAVSATTAQIGVNVVNWNNTVVATPATAGIPDINIKNINNTAAATPGASGGLLISGSNSGTTTLGALTITGVTTHTGATVHTGNVSMAAGLTITQSSSNASAVSITGNGTGHGLLVTSGSGATGDGIRAVSAATDGRGIFAQGVGSGAGLHVFGGAAGNGATFQAGAAGHGIHSQGGASSGHGVNILAQTGNYYGISSVGHGDGHGLYVAGGSGGTGSGLFAEGGTDGISGVGHGIGAGLGLHGGPTAGPGIYAEGGTGGTGGPGAQFDGGPTSGVGLSINGFGTGIGLYVAAGATADGVVIRGGAISGNGVTIAALAGDGTGMQVSGIGAGVGLYVIGGATADGADFQGGSSSGDGISVYASSGDGNGVSFYGNGAGSGVYVSGGNPNGSALQLVGKGTGFDIKGTDTSSAVKATINITQTGADKVWDTVLASHLTAGSTGAALNVAGAVGDPWTTALPGAYGAGTAGFIVGTNLNATVSSRLAPTVAGRTLDVSTGGEAGLDWANIGSPTTTVALTGTTLSTSLVVASVTGAVGSVTGAVGSVTGNVGGNVTGSVGSVVGAVGSVTAGVTVTTNNDKTGYSLSSTQTFSNTGTWTGNITGNLSGSVGSVTSGVTVATNSDKTGYTLTSAYDPAKTAAQAGDAMALTSGERLSVADAFLKRDMSAVTGEAARSPLNALRFLRNKWTVSGVTLTVTKEDDTTSAWTSTVTATPGADPITASDPA